MLRSLGAVALASAALCGCVSPPAGPVPASTPASSAPGPAPEFPGQAAAPQYRCDQNTAFTVRFTNDSAVLDVGARGSEVLLRDAGGITPQQTVYSNPRLRAEFGLGAGGREAILRYLSPASVLNCVRD
jgi:hypothetical protein